MNPWSPFTYYKRLKRRILLLVAIITMAMIGLFLMVGVLDTIPLRANANYLNYVSRVYPKAGSDLEPGVISQLQIHQDVDRVVSETGLNINYPVLVGNERLRLLGVSAEDANYLVVFALFESMIAVVAAVALATLNFIFFSQRKDKFGILNALGFSRRWLTLRTMQETGSVVFLAWLIGAIISMLGLALAQQFIYSPIGLKAEIGNLTPWLFTLPTPIAVVLANTGMIYSMLRKLDPVTIIERR